MSRLVCRCSSCRLTILAIALALAGTAVGVALVLGWQP